MADEEKKSDEPASTGAGDIPEVEAEIVQEGEAPAADQAFADSETPDNTADPVADKKPTPKRMPFTPGVILFLGFAAFALVVFILWWIQGVNDVPPTDAPQQIEEAAPADAHTEDNGDAAAQAPDATIPTVSETDDVSVDPAVEASVSTDADKIENSAAADLKSASSGIDPVTDITEGGDIYLPPLGSGDGTKIESQTLQETVKEAFRSLDPATAPSPTESVQDTTAPASGISGFDVEDENSAAAPADQSVGDQPTMAIGDQASDVDASEDRLASAEIENSVAAGAVEHNNKLLNDMSALKESFEAEKAQLTIALEEERRRNAAQQEEIEKLRRDFQAALGARDEEASAETHELRERLEKIRNNEIAPVKRRVAGAAALKSLERVVDQGAPYANELERLEETAPGAPAFVVLRQHAATGLAPISDLKERFGDAAREALAAADKERATGFWGALKAQALSIFVTWPADPQPGNGPRAVISRAEYAVESSNLSGALAELMGLSPIARDAMASWITDAQARIEARAAIEDLNNLILGAL